MKHIFDDLRAMRVSSAFVWGDTLKWSPAWLYSDWSSQVALGCDWLRGAAGGGGWWALSLSELELGWTQSVSYADIMVREHSPAHGH